MREQEKDSLKNKMRVPNIAGCELTKESLLKDRTQQTVKINGVIEKEGWTILALWVNISVNILYTAMLKNTLRSQRSS